MDLPLRVGRYEVLRLLGQGGMGRVLLARDTVLGREVAIKLLRDDLGLPPETREALFARMRQEARAAATVSHPNMVVLHDMGEEEKVGLFLVFEYVRGPTLRERIASGGGLPPGEIIFLARELGAALDVAHAAGIVHRDVKPENVLLPDTGAKLTDFGIARIPDSTLTQAGAVLGTVAYSAPEALTVGEFSARSDQFSLAATLYEALSGGRPFPGEDTLAVASRIATEEPRTVRRGENGPELPRAHLVLARGLHKDPKARFPSCSAFAEALAAALDPEGDAPRSSMLPPASVLPPAKTRVQNIVAVLAVLAIAALLAFGRHPMPGKEPVQDPKDEADATPPVDPPKKARPAPVHHETRKARDEAGAEERRDSAGDSGARAQDDAGVITM